MTLRGLNFFRALHVRDMHALRKAGPRPFSQKSCPTVLICGISLSVFLLQTQKRLELQPITTDLAV